MAGRLVVSTLNNDTGVLNVQNGMTGIPKAWVQFAGATGTIASSFNVTSITIIATGYYTVTFTTAMVNANYSIVGSASSTSGTGQGNVIQPFTNPATGTTVAPTTASFNFSSLFGSGTATTPIYINIAVFGS
jgi:hypothetical protein